MHLTIFLSICLFVMSINVYAMSSFSSLLGCSISDLEEPERKAFSFEASISIKDMEHMKNYKIKGVCTFDRQYCGGGSLSNLYKLELLREDSLGSQTYKHDPKWIIKPNKKWELVFEMPNCNRLISFDERNYDYRVWLDKNPSLRYDKKTTQWRSELIKEDSLQLHGLKVINTSIDVK